MVARRTTRANRSGARSSSSRSKSRGRASRGSSSNTPCQGGAPQSWIHVQRPPAPGVSFLVKQWVPLTDLSEKERTEYADQIEKVMKRKVEKTSSSSSPVPQLAWSTEAAATAAAAAAAVNGLAATATIETSTETTYSTANVPITAPVNASITPPTTTGADSSGGSTTVPSPATALVLPPITTIPQAKRQRLEGGPLAAVVAASDVGPSAASTNPPSI